MSREIQREKSESNECRSKYKASLMIDDDRKDQAMICLNHMEGARAIKTSCIGSISVTCQQWRITQKKKYHPSTYPLIADYLTVDCYWCRHLAPQNYPASAKAMCLNGLEFAAQKRPRVVRQVNPFDRSIIPPELVGTAMDH